MNAGEREAVSFPGTQRGACIMKLAVPSESDAGLSAQRSGHFGHCAYFTIVTIEDGEVASVESVENLDHDQYGCGGIIDYVISLGVDAILTAGMGRPPLTRFTQAGVTVYSEAQSPLVGTAVERFIAGEAVVMTPDMACNHR